MTKPLATEVTLRRIGKNWVIKDERNRIVYRSAIGDRQRLERIVGSIVTLMEETSENPLTEYEYEESARGVE